MEDAAWALEEGLKKPGVERSLGASRDQGAARCPPSQPRRAGHAHAMPAALEPSAPRPTRDADPLAHRRKEQQRLPPSTGLGARRAVLARHPRPLPGRGPGAQALLWRSVMSCFVSILLPHLPIERLKRERAASGTAPLDR